MQNAKHCAMDICVSSHSSVLLLVLSTAEGIPLLTLNKKYKQVMKK